MLNGLKPPTRSEVHEIMVDPFWSSFFDTFTAACEQLTVCCLPFHYKIKSFLPSKLYKSPLQVGMTIGITNDNGIEMLSGAQYSRSLSKLFFFSIPRRTAQSLVFFFQIEYQPVENICNKAYM